MNLVCRCLRADFYVPIPVLQRFLDQRFDCWFIELPEPSCQMAQTDEGVSPHLVVLMGGQCYAYCNRIGCLFSSKSERQGNELQLRWVIPIDCVSYIFRRKGIEILKSGHWSPIIQQEKSNVKECMGPGLDNAGGFIQYEKVRKEIGKLWLAARVPS